MNLASASDLKRWANLREAQARLPHLVRRLISATGDGLSTLTMPAGEGVAKPGWDGVVVTEDSDLHVPAGPSVWEMGVNTDPRRKANKDYSKRRNNPGDLDPQNSTFVFVTPRRWSGKSEWVEKKRKDSFWKHVLAYDADDLETWLERAPGAHAWISALLGLDPYEVESLETWWDSWSEATNPALPAALFLAGREKTVEEFRARIKEETVVLAMSGDSQDEVIAFIAAIFLSNEPTARQHLERALVVRTPGAWRHVAVSDQSLSLLPLYERPDAPLADRHGHHVLIPLGRETPITSGIEIPRLRREGIEAALTELGLSRNRAVTLATLGRRSLHSLRRALAISPELQTPEWSRPENARDITPAVLAGSWSDGSAEDQEILERLAGKPYEEVVRTLTRWANTSDPPVRRVGNVWGVTSKEDAWRLTARLLTAHDLDRFRQVAQDVLGADNPVLDLPQEERMVASIRGINPPYSEQITRGIADTLALMATMSNQILLAGERRGQDEVDTVVYRLLDAANKDRSGRSWTVLSSSLPLLAEASPTEFLDAVDRNLASSDPVILRMFQDGIDV